MVAKLYVTVNFIWDSREALTRDKHEPVQRASFASTPSPGPTLPLN